MPREPESPTHPKAARLLCVAGALGLAASFAGLLAGIAWISAWFYVGAWWSCIAALDGIVHLRSGRSLLLSRPRAFCLLAIASSTFWLFFELVNLRLENWYYVGIPRDAWARTFGVWASFATVLPGVLELRALVDTFGGSRHAAHAGASSAARGASARHVDARTIAPWILRALELAGLAFLLLPLWLPTYFFPLVWGATVLTLEPRLWRRGEPCLLADVMHARGRGCLRLLIAGLLAGGLWEALNWHASAKWIYTVPFFEESKLFEMPVLGFLGFPPFALECFTFARALVAWRLVPEWDPTLPQRERRPRREWIGALALIVCAVPAIRAVDVFTLRATLPMLDELPRIETAEVERLRDAGLARPRDVARALVAPPDVDPRRFDAWREAARLMELKGLGARGLQALAAVDVHTVASLAAQDPARLVERLRADADANADADAHHAPRPAEVRVWVRAARRASE